MTKASRTDSYTTVHEFKAELRGDDIRVVSKPGFPAWNHITPATALLAQAIEVEPTDRVLLFGSGHGALAVALARQLPHGSLVVLDLNSVALTMTARTLQANGIEQVTIWGDPAHPPTEPDSFDLAVIELPPGRKLARRVLATAHAALHLGGRLFIAGPNNEGIQPAIDDAQALFGSAMLLAYKERNRIARATKTALEHAPDWLHEPGIAPGTWYEFETALRGHHFDVRSLPGTFAYDRIDDGTALLLEHLQPSSGATMLDIGCGYGIIGLLAARLGARRIDLVDANLLSIAAAQENIRCNAVDGATAFPSDVLSAVRDRSYDLIVTNPPFHTGKTITYDVAHAFIEESRAALAPSGRFMLVANAFLPYEPLLRTMYRTVSKVAQTRQFQILAAEKPIALGAKGGRTMDKHRT